MSIFKNPSVIAAFIGAIVALISLFLNVLLSIKTHHLANFLEVSKSAIKFKKCQLDEFYGPLLAITRQNTHLARRIKDIEKSQFHVLDHLPQILDRPDIGPIVNLLLKNNRRIEELLLSKSSLIKGNDLPESFNLFLVHCALLRSAIEGKPLKERTQSDYYPHDFNIIIEKHFKELKHEISEIFLKRSDFFKLT